MDQSDRSVGVDYVSVATHPTSMPNTRGGLLGWNIDISYIGA